MKSGTTSLHHYLNGHPDVFMSEPKEPQYFVDTTLHPDDLDWYLGLFDGVGDERYLGESSTFYSMLPEFPGPVERIREFNPDSFFIYIMRDPVDRILSHYWHMVRQRDEWRPLRRLIDEDGAYLAVSDYAMQLRPYLDAFGEERVKTLTFEEMKADPLGSVNDIFRWLDLPAMEDLPVVGRRFNARPEVLEKAKGAALLYRLRRSALWERLSPFVPGSVKRLGKRASEGRVRPDAQDLSRVVQKIRPLLAERVKELSSLLERDFPEWTTLHRQTPESG